MKTIIYTSFPCLIRFNNEEETINQNENLVIEEEFEKLFIYPTERGRISFEISTNEHENSFYRIIERGNKRLIFLLDGLYAENVEVGEISYNGMKSRIEIYSQKVIFSNNDSKKIIHLNQKYKTFKFGNIKHINYCLLKCFNDEEILLVYNARKNNARVFNANEIIEEENGWTLVSSAFGYSSISQTIYVDDEGLKVKKKDFNEIVSTQQAPLETLPYQFLNCIKLGDYKRALAMLSPSLNDRLNEESLKAYFGNVGYFYMISPNSAYAISNDKNVIYEFQVSNKKISEISSE